MRIGVTGSKGLIGWHTCCYLKAANQAVPVMATRETFQSPSALAEFVAQCDAIIHFAGVNRGDDDELYQSNVRLASDLIQACEDSRSTPHIVFSSSTHIKKDTAYGRSKRECAARFKGWADRTGGAFTELVLPHVFGEGGKPFYNSVVSTFCHQIAQGEVPSVNAEGQVELLHALDVAKLALKTVQEKRTGQIRVPGRPMTVGALLDQITRIAEDYASQIVPDLQDPFRLALFNTYRSYLFPRHYPVALKKFEDPRGGLVEVVKSRNGGQTFFSTTKPGITRGNHYHTRKVERFLVVEGQAIIRLRKLFSDEVIEYPVNGGEPRYVDMPTYHTHSITNVGSGGLVTLFWSNEIFDPADPDTFPEPVLEA